MVPKTKLRMINMKLLTFAAAVAASLTLAQPVYAGDIVETAQSAGTFKTLLAAANAVGLVGVLSGEGPLTVFAPNDAAFATLPAGTVENLLKPENKDQLVALLSYHVVGRKIDSATAIETCKMNGVEPQAYIADVIAKIAADWPASRWDELMPWNWKATEERARLAA